MKKNTKSNKVANIVLTVIMFALSFAAVEYGTGLLTANFFEFGGSHSVPVGTGIPINGTLAGIFFALFLAAGIIAIFKICFVTRLAWENNKQSNLIKAIFIIEIVTIVMLFMAAFSIFMHGAMEAGDIAPKLTLPVIIISLFAGGLILTNTILNAVNDLRK